METHATEIGSIWSPYAVASEWQPLLAVLVHTPGDELQVEDPHSALMLELPDTRLAQGQHRAMCARFRELGVEVHEVAPTAPPSPNQMFCADLFAMTPQGAILARPAGRARAGEERWVAARLAQLGVPILRTLTGEATFEGADLMWLDERTAMIGKGHRTNQAAIDQIRATLSDIGCALLPVDLPFGTMHFMGMLRIVDKDLAVCWPRRTPVATVRALQDRGFVVSFIPADDDHESYRAMNFVTLGPREILLAAGLFRFQSFFDNLRVRCETVPTDELSKAAGGVGCLTGVLSRRRAPA